MAVSISFNNSASLKYCRQSILAKLVLSDLSEKLAGIGCSGIDNSVLSEQPLKVDDNKAMATLQLILRFIGVQIDSVKGASSFLPRR